MPNIKNIMVRIITMVAFLGITGLVAYFASSPQESKGPSFLPGVYVCRAGNEFCRIDDTIIIRRGGSTGGLGYSIIRKSAFVRVVSGKTGLQELQQDQWESVYDPLLGVLTSAGRVDTIRYFENKNRIKKNDFTYEKIE